MSLVREYILKGLCCANCAAHIEEEVGALSQVKEASVNLMNENLHVTMNSENAEDITEQVKKIVASHEPSVKVISIGKDSKAASGSGAAGAVSGNTAKEESSQEIRNYFIRIGAAFVITAFVSALPISKDVRLAALLVAYLIAGYEILWNACKNIARGQVFDENFLMSIASVGAFLIGDQVEAIAVLIFYGIGELLQEIAVHRSKKDITELMDIRPDYANLVKGTSVQTVTPEQVKAGERILVKPGEKLPLDGVVVRGNSAIDTRALTGESIPQEVGIGDTVLFGTVNTSGTIEVEVTKPFSEATVSRILELVQNAGSKKAPGEKFITRFARYYTPAVVFTAAAVAIIPPVFGFGDFTQWLYRALSFLIISCPCALVISIPLSFFGGIGGGAKQGVLIKGGNYLDALKRVDTIVFDKTGTLTRGVLEVTRVHPVKGVTEDELVRIAAIAEKHSLHPVAKSISTYYNRGKALELGGQAQITEIAGHGVVAEAENRRIYAGNDKLMKKYNIILPEYKVSGSVVHIAADEKYLGYIQISDTMKDKVKETIHALKQLGVRKTVMLTGDHEEAAREIAAASGIDEYKAGLLPQDKVSWFEKYKKAMTGKDRIIFVGDGINDAPVLAMADVGIAMGGVGSDAAIEAADVVIMNDDIGKLVTAIKIARKTNSIVIQNIIFALGVKFIIMLLAFLGVTSIWFAIFADVGVALIALVNAMRAMKGK